MGYYVLGTLGIVLLVIIAVVAAIIIKTSNAHKQTSISPNTPQAAENKEKESSMKYCSNCGAEIHENAVVCIKCGCATAPKSPYGQTSYEPDVQSAGLNILSFLFPLVGLILYIVFNEKTPMKAKAIGKWAIIGFVAGIVLYIFSFSIFMFL